MFRLISSLKNRRGFTLIELIVVLAVLAIIMAIAVPRFLGVQDQARIDADKAAAEQIIKSARLQEAKNNDGNKIVKGTAGTGETAWDATIMDYPTPQSGGAFVLSGGANIKYAVKWTPTKGSITGEQTVNEQ